MMKHPLRSLATTFRRSHAAAVAFLVVGSFAASVANAHPASYERLVLINAQIAADPTNPDLYVKRGQIHLEDVHWDAALADYEKAIELGVNADVADYVRGELFVLSEKPAQAEGFFDRLLKRQPGHAKARLLRARARAALGRQSEAADDFLQTLQDTPRASPDLYVEVIHALVAAGRNPKALALADQGCERLGVVTSLAHEAVELEVAAKMYDQALKRLADLIERPGFRERWLVRRAEVFELAERQDEAYLAWQKARDALAKRPAHRRKAKVLQELQQEIDRALERLATEE
jgi:tetratricopeptide (TPR) repeat protein